MRRHQTHAHGHENLERWLLTYADMITLLTAFFLMLYSMSVVSKGKFSALATSMRGGFGGVLQNGSGILRDSKGNEAAANAENYRQYQDSMQDFRHYVEQQGRNAQAQVRHDERGIVISLVADGALFGEGSANLQPGSQPLLARIGRILQHTSNTVQVEGHTDNVPIQTGQFPSNWELSTGRAGSVLRYFTSQARLPNKRFTCAGYADTRPFVTNDTPENRAKNRRVDIILLKTEAQREADLLRRQEVRRISQASPSGNTPAPASASANEIAPAGPSPSAASEPGTTAPGGNTDHSAPSRIPPHPPDSTSAGGAVMEP